MIKQQLRKHKEEQFQKKARQEIALKEELSNLNNKDYIESSKRRLLLEQ